MAKTTHHTGADRFPDNTNLSSIDLQVNLSWGDFFFLLLLKSWPGSVLKCLRHRWAQQTRWQCKKRQNKLFNGNHQQLIMEEEGETMGSQTVLHAGIAPAGLCGGPDALHHRAAIPQTLNIIMRRSRPVWKVSILISGQETNQIPAGFKLFRYLVQLQWVGGVDWLSTFVRTFCLIFIQRNDKFEFRFRFEFICSLKRESPGP